jgi:hypothetical protein
MEIAPGQLVGKGRFEVLSRIGAGGAGLVYEVRDRKSDAHLALKTVRSIYRPDTLVLLKREFRAVQDLAHPNLVRLDELFEENGVWFFTMELVEGMDWLMYVRPHNGSADGPYETRVRSTLVQIVEALSALHAAGTVHRDVKPSNVLVSSYGSVKLLDFGLAAQSDRISDPMADGLVGTLNYMAPELLRMREPLPAGDFYAVGVMLYQALTGKFPFFEHAPELVRARLSGEPTPVRQVNPNAPFDLAELCDSLLKRNPQARPTGPAILRALGVTAGASSSDAPSAEDFVGRARELAVLEDAFAATREGAPVTVVIEGASGVGKSALVRRFLVGMRGQALVLDGRCHEREYVPYKGLDAIMDQLASHLADPSQPAPGDLESTTMRLLPRLFPVLRNVRAFAETSYGQRPNFEPGSRELRSRTYRAFRDLVASIARLQPLVIAIDDVQWADDDTLELLGDMLAPPGAPPVLLVCTRRVADEGSDEESTRPRPAFPGDVRRLTLGGLAPEEVSTLASRLSDRAPLGRAELDQIVAESGGHPLFLQELVRRRLDGSHASSRLRLDEALWSRVSRLDEHERQIVEAVTVAGIPTDLELIAAAASIPRRDLPRHMATLRGANLVRLSGTNDARRVEPYHDRVREAVAVHLDASKIRKWHERLAKVLETYPEREVDQLAVHWEGAGDAKRAAELFREAADRASAALAFDRAVEFYRRALALGGDDLPERAAVEKLLAEALLNAGRGGEAGRAFLELAAHEPDGAAVDLQRRAAQAFLVSGHFADGRAALERAIAVAGFRLPEGRLSLILRILWCRLLIRMRGFALRRRAANELAARDVMKVDVCWSAAHGFAMSDVMTGAVFHALGARKSLQLGDPTRATRALCSYAMSSSTTGRKGRRITAKILRAARSLAAQLRDPFLNGMVAGAEGFAAFMLEDWRTALVHFSDAETRFRDECVGATYELDTTHAMKGRTLAHLGRLTELDAHMTPMLRDAIRRNDLYGVINIRTISGVLLALARNDVAGAQRELDESGRVLSLQGFQAQHLYCLMAAGMVDLYRGTPEAALARLDEQRPLVRRSLLDHVQSMRVNMLYLRARLHLAIAARDAQPRHLASATRFGHKLLRERLPGSTALGQLVLGCAAMIGGDERRATALFREAIARFDHAGMALHAACTRYALGGMVGGEAGRRLVANAGAYFDKQRIADIAQFVELHLPGVATPEKRSTTEERAKVESALVAGR